MKDLKPCPFCGSSELDYGIYNGPMREYSYIQCENCLAEIHAKGNIDDAGEAWNRRIGIPNLLFGFPVDDLVKIAILLRQDGYDPKGVPKLLDDLKNTYEYCLDHIKMEFERTASGIFGRLKIDL